jgi:predicted porin
MRLLVYSSWISVLLGASSVAAQPAPPAESPAAAAPAPLPAAASPPATAPAPLPAAESPPAAAPKPAKPSAGPPLEFTIYGTLMEFGEVARTTGATPAGSTTENSLVGAYSGTNLPRRGRLTSGTSNIGFRGSYEIIPGVVKAIFQIENSASPDGDAPNAWASRNSQVGLAGSFGTVFYGNWDTPYKAPLPPVGPLRGLLPFDNAISASPGFSVPATTTQSGRAGAKADAAFNRRQGNSVQYWTPKQFGLQARLAFGFDESRTTATPATGTAQAVPSIDPMLFSGLVSFDHEGLGLRYAFERHVDYFGLAQLGGAGPSLNNTGSTDDGHEIIAFYALPTGTKLSGIYDHLAYSSDDSTMTNAKKFSRDSFYFLAEQQLGPNKVWGAFGMALKGSCSLVSGAACTTSGLGATQWSVGYARSLISTVDVYAAYYRMVNDRSASYSTFPALVTATAPGSDASGFGVGILYAFAATWPKPPAP